MTWLRRYWPWLVFAALAVVAIVFVPQDNDRRRGSTYARTPDGYGAWFQALQAQKVPVRRFLKPAKDLPAEAGTLVQVVHEPIYSLGPDLRQWVEKGRTLVILGAPAGIASTAGIELDRGWIKAPANDLRLASSAGPVLVETRRRYPGNREGRALLGDRHGVVVWEYPLGQGRLLVSVTPYLAANTYQGEPGNFAFLNRLVLRDKRPVLVDEYIHGYREPGAQSTEDQEDGLLAYLGRTPVAVVFTQLIVLVLACVWAARRFGRPIKLPEGVPPGSAAYIEALAAVLQKANSHAFVFDTVGRQERARLVRVLGLGDGSGNSDVQEIKAAWTARTGRPASELEPLLGALPTARDDRALATWLGQLQSLHHPLDIPPP